MKIALIHDWLVGMRGGEQVLQTIASMVPSADLYTLIHDPKTISEDLNQLRIQTSFLQKIPSVRKHYRYFLPLFPKAIESFDLSQYDLVISSSHCVAKGVLKNPHAVHISYIHAPMRYMWDRFDDYFSSERCSLPVRLAARSARHYMQKWDYQSSSLYRIDNMIANSHFIADQIRTHYGREARVIHPFVRWERFQRERTPTKAYLYLGALVPYKRVDLAIEAFNDLKLPLLVAGTGSDERRLRKMAGPTIEFLGNVAHEEVPQLYSRAKGFVFPAKEDFGIAPLEAMAAGTPVVAFQEGGASETVTAQTGILFPEQNKESLIHAIEAFEKKFNFFDEQDCRQRAKEFSIHRFKTQFIQEVLQTWEKCKGPSSDLLDLFKDSPPARSSSAPLEATL